MQIKDLIPWGRDRNAPARKTEESENPLLSLQQDINRVFDSFWSRFDRPFSGSNGFLSSGGPSIDILDRDEEIEVSVELPGMEEKDIDVSLTPDAMTIRGEKKAEKEEKRKGYYLSERSYGSFFRSVALPPGIDTDNAHAELRKGILTIRLPKTAEARGQAKRIEIKAG